MLTLAAELFYELRLNFGELILSHHSYLKWPLFEVLARHNTIEGPIMHLRRAKDILQSANKFVKISL